MTTSHLPLEKIMGFLDKFRGRRDEPVVPTRPSFVQRSETSSTPVAQPRFAVIDVETTGLSSSQHRIVEIAVVTTDPWGRVLDEWTTRVNPQGPIGATHVHGIRDSDVTNAPVFADVVAHLNVRLAGAAIAAHHARFDLAFVRAEYARAGWDMPFVPALCTLEASEYHLPSLDRRRLGDCCWAVGTQLTDAHSALGDARATAGLLAAFMHPHVGYPPLPEHVAMPSEALSVAWPPGPSRAPASPRQAAPTRDVSARARVVMAQQATAPQPETLVELVEQFSLVDALDEGAPAGAIAYLEKLAEVLEDGEVTAEEAADLEAIADAEQLTNADITSANQAFVRALAYAALEDGKVTRAERAEIQQVSDLLGVDGKVIPALLDHAEHARNTRLSVGLSDLPADWTHGEPLRVGDKVVFTGCDEAVRTNLETKSEDLGVRVVSAVSAKTAMLVTDGTMDGGKAAKARELSTRTVHPDTYAVLLAHLQPSLSRGTKALPRTPARQVPMHAAGTATEAVATEAFSTVGVATPAGPNPSAVRAWARANGHEVGTRGRLHKDLIDAYVAANPDR